MKIKFLLLSFGLVACVVFLVSGSGLLAQKASTDSSTILCEDEEANCSRNEHSQLVEEFWRLAQSGEIDAAKELRTDLIVAGDAAKGGTVSVIDTSPTGWEDTINETGMTYIRTVGVSCSNGEECKVVSQVKNRWGREIKFVHVLRIRDGDWKILHIMW